VSCLASFIPHACSQAFLTGVLGLIFVDLDDMPATLLECRYAILAAALGRLPLSLACWKQALTDAFRIDRCTRSGCFCQHGAHGCLFLGGE